MQKTLRLSQLTVLLVLTLTIIGFRDRPATRWVAIGDSITYLNDHADETGDRVKKGYLTRVTGQFKSLEYINKGYNGWTSGGIAEKIEELGLGSADIYSIFLGTNDYWQGRPVGVPDDYRENRGNATVYGSFRIIINKLRALNPQAKILLITPMKRGDFVYINDFRNNSPGSYLPKNGQLLESFANAIDSIGIMAGASVIDLYHNPNLTLDRMVKFKRVKDPSTGQYRNYPYPDYTGIPFNPATDEYPYPPEAIDLTYDGLHPADRGNELIAAAIVKEFRKFGIRK